MNKHLITKTLQKVKTKNYINCVQKNNEGEQKRKISFIISSILSSFTIYQCVVNIIIYSGVIVFCTRLRNKQGRRRRQNNHKPINLPQYYKFIFYYLNILTL